MGEIAGALAVFASLIYLAVQIRNSNRIELATSERETIDAWNRLTQTILGDETSARIYVQGMHDIHSHSDSERWVFVGHCSVFLSHYGESLRMHRRGLLDDDQLSAAAGHVVAILKSPGGSYFWSQLGSFYDFSPDIEKLLQENIESGAYTDLEMFQLTTNEGVA